MGLFLLALFLFGIGFVFVLGFFPVALFFCLFLFEGCFFQRFVIGRFVLGLFFLFFSLFAKLLGFEFFSFFLFFQLLFLLEGDKGERAGTSASVEEEAGAEETKSPLRLEGIRR